MKKSTAEWVRKVDEDLAIARRIRRGKSPLHNGVCFHCQQCGEKFLKALLEELGRSIPKIHDLDELLKELLPFHPSLRALNRGLAFLTNFAVGIRYPGDDASKRQAVAALKWAVRVRQEARTLLGISPRRRRGRSGE